MSYETRLRDGDMAQPTITPRLMAFVDQFTHNLKILTRDLVKRCPNDATIYRAEKRIMTGISIDPLHVINTVGPYLLSYKEQIYNFGDKSETFFMENTFDTELKSGVNQDKVDLVSYIIPKVKECARNVSKSEKQGYMDLVVCLLDDYIEFLTGMAENSAP